MSPSLSLRPSDLQLTYSEHAGNAAMLHALGITHVVSVGESLISCPVDCDPMYGQIGTNTLSAETAAGRIQVLDLADIRDDGNDPLRPLIARACGWIEEARQNGGVVLVHCVGHFVCVAVQPLI
jgi:dual specificity MAP kinase phosphatase